MANIYIVGHKSLKRIFHDGKKDVLESWVQGPTVIDGLLMYVI